MEHASNNGSFIIETGALVYEGMMPNKCAITPVNLPEENLPGLLYSSTTCSMKMPICIITNDSIIDAETFCGTDRREISHREKNTNPMTLKIEDFAEDNVAITSKKLDNKRFGSLRLARNKLLSKDKRSNSLPLSFQTLQVENTHSDDVTMESNYECERDITATPLNVISLAEDALRAVVTPPPSYRSLVKQNLDDIPPLYEIVTGRPINLGPESPQRTVKRSESVCHRIHLLPRNSKIFIAAIIITLILATVILVLAEILSK